MKYLFIKADNIGKLMFLIMATAVLPSLLMSNSVNELKGDLENIDRALTEVNFNESYKPYVVTTLEGSDLQLLGVRTLEEALTIVAGVDMHMSELNDKEFSIRGSNPNSYGQTQLYIDGVLVNNVVYDGYSEYLQMPVEIIKRIEVIRGNNAQVSVFNYYAGAIKVITYAEQGLLDADAEKNAVFGRAGSRSTFEGGGIMSFKEGDAKVVMDAYYHTDKNTAESGYDAASTGRYNFPTLGIDNTDLSRKGEVNLGKESYGIGAKISQDGLYALTRFQFYNSGVAYGQAYLLPDESYDNKIEEPNHHIEIGYEGQKGDLEYKISAGYRFNKLMIKSLAAPAGFEFPSLNGTPTAVTFTEGLESEFTTVQQQGYQNTMLSYEGIMGHKLSVGYRVIYDKTTDVEAYGTDRFTGTGIVNLVNIAPPITPGAERTVVRGVLGDQAEIGRFSAIAALSAEKDTLSGDVFYEPKASLAYLQSSEHIYKFLYSRSYRYPSWQELFAGAYGSKYGNTELKPERVDSFEIAFVSRRGKNNYLQATVFYLLNKDQITNANTFGVYENKYDSTLYGAEFELHSDIGVDGRIYASYSYAGGVTGSGDHVSNLSSHMLKGYYLYRLGYGFTAGTILRHNSSKKRRDDDPRVKDLPSFTTVDLTLNYKEPVTGFEANMAIKNAFDEVYYLPSDPYTYDDDYLQPGRSIYVTITKEF